MDILSGENYGILPFLLSTCFTDEASDQLVFSNSISIASHKMTYRGVVHFRHMFLIASIFSQGFPIESDKTPANFSHYFTDDIMSQSTLTNTSILCDALEIDFPLLFYLSTRMLKNKVNILQL